MRVIFLDVDGVLNYAHYKEPFHEFEPECFKCLKKIVDETDARIVISSSWKQDYLSLAKLNQELRKYGLSSVGATPNMASKEDEIQYWLNMHKSYDTYVVIDDDDMEKTFPGRMVRTVEHMRVGLDDDWAKQAKEILLAQ